MTRAQKKAQDAVALNGQTGSLQERAMLVDLTVHRWYAKTTDRTATTETARRFRMDVRMGNYRKRLIGSEALLKIVSAAGRLEQIHHKWTMPWNDNGGRVLAAVAYFDYTKEMAVAKEEFETATRDFVENYQEYYRDAQQRLGERFDPADYPTIRDIAGRFRVDIVFLPIPTGSDFRTKLGDGDLTALRSSLETDLKGKYETAMRDPWLRLHKVVSKLVERVNAFKVTDKGRGPVFQDCTIEHIEEVLDLLPALNIGGDPKLSAMAEEIRRTLIKDPGAIRDDERVRSKTARDAEAIVKQLADFI